VTKGSNESPQSYQDCFERDRTRVGTGESYTIVQSRLLHFVSKVRLGENLDECVTNEGVGYRSINGPDKDLDRLYPIYI
jgi:hypothetical protein